MQKNQPTATPIAIIGMGSIFAKSFGLKEYWKQLLHGIDGITDPPDSHSSLNDYFDKDPKKPDHIYCNRGGFLSPVPFDPTEFGIPPASLEATDTSQLLGLVTAKMALENAGYGLEKEYDKSQTSVILGVTGTQELVISLGSRLGHPKWRKALKDSGIDNDKAEEIIQRISDAYVGWQENSFPGLLGNVVAGRISNRLNLGGTNCVVDAACASSLSAIHLALLELYSGRSNMVVAGGVDTINDIFMHMCFSKTGVLSHTGDAKPFSKDADGTVLGEGIGLLVLKRLDDAERDGDRIYSVIKGIGSSSDGKSQSIYAPTIKGQSKALSMAYEIAGVSPETVRLVEAHGTGTRVGDQVEFNALNRVFGAITPNGNRCALGSVKSMIGHTKAAAGAAGLIKTALALHNKVLPPTLKAKLPDPGLGIEKSPFYLNTGKRPWISDDSHPRRGGISAFGFGGSNFHAVVEEYKKKKHHISWDGSVEIIALSGSDRTFLIDELNALKRFFLEKPSGSKIANRAHQSRKAFSHMHKERLLITLDLSCEEDKPARLIETALKRLRENSGINKWQYSGIFYKSGSDSVSKTAFIFPGQGSQYINMGMDLVCHFPQALETMEMVNDCIQSPDLFSDRIYPRPAPSENVREDQENTLKNTENAQVAIGAVSSAMFSVLDYFKVTPDVACGHSYGELTALYAAGWIDKSTLFRLSVERGRLMAKAGLQKDSGAMLAVMAPLPEMNMVLSEMDCDDITLANINSPSQMVMSGPTLAVTRLEKKCREKGLRTIKLPVSAAFHSSFMVPAKNKFKKVLSSIPMDPTNTPVYSNVTTSPYPHDRSQAINLLGEQLTSPVDFAGEIEQMYKDGVRTFVEVGPKTVLTGLVKSILKNREFEVVSMDASMGNAFGIIDLANTLGAIAANGIPVDLTLWEKPIHNKRVPKMNIPLCGANYKSQEKPKAGTIKPAVSVPGPGTIKPKNHIGSKENTVHLSGAVESISTPPVSPQMSHKETVPGPQANPFGFENRYDESKPPSEIRSNPPRIQATLDIVQKGLESMQDLQLQTTRAHQKFLDTQAEAGRTLQEMIKGARSLFASNTDPHPSNTAMALPDKSPILTKSNTLNSTSHPVDINDYFDGVKSRQLTTADTHRDVESKPDHNKKTTGGVNTPDQSSMDTGIKATLLSIVSELTGYPGEMLGLDMDIESDLGIDSIKRVEILSALEEKMPHLPQVTPDMLGTLKTLGQIVDYLSQGSDETQIPAALPDEPPADNSEADSSIKATLLSIVSELTGYPGEMLGLDMDIESDLGIDSIKRVEILSAVEEKMPHLPQVTPDMLGTLKTLGQITAYLSGDSDVSPQPPGGLPPHDDEDEAKPFNKTRPQPVPRQIVRVRNTPRTSSTRLVVGKEKIVFITEDNAGLSNALTEAFRSHQIKTRTIDDSFTMSSDEFKNAAGLIITDQTEPRAAFIMAKCAAKHLLTSSDDDGDSFFSVITRLDGCFGFNGDGVLNPVQGSLTGLAKTASIEWDTVYCRAFDVDPQWMDMTAIASTIVKELLSPDAEAGVEIGLDEKTRYTLHLESSTYPHGNLDLSAEDVVVITGGARGVTASCAEAIARTTRANLVLIGRSPAPFSEPIYLNDVTDDMDMKKAILENDFPNKNVAPKELECAFQSYKNNRHILATIDKIRSYGSKVIYYQADVKNKNDIETVFEQIRADLGSIHAVVHGAGVLEDRLIIDKTLEQFDRVYDTKVKGLENLVQAIGPDPLKYLVLFSSISARVGNRGQVDYAMANEVMNKTAWNLNKQRPEIKVISINWGPWDGGMVTPGLKKAFKQNGIRLIPVEAGAASLIHEMQGNRSEPVEVVIGANQINASDDDGNLESDHLRLLVKQELDLHGYPVLSSHMLGGKPVVPFALVAEWLGHSALHENPGLHLLGIDNMRLLNGIKLETEKKLVRLMAGKSKRIGDSLEVNVEIRNGKKNGRDVIHSRGRAILAEVLPSPPKFHGFEKNGHPSFPDNMETVYNQILFHGAAFRGIKKITYFSDKEIMADIQSAPDPSQWIKNPMRDQWVSDPLVLDCAFQMAIIWCHENKGKVCLPSYMASYRQYCQAFPKNGVTVLFQVTAADQYKITGDFTFLDRENTVVANLYGYEAIMDADLMNSFNRDGIKSDQTAQ